MALREIYDALTKRKKLEKAFKIAQDMLKRDKFMFNEVCNALVEGRILRRSTTLKKANIVDIVSEEDAKINGMEIEVRKGVFEYLALNSAPDIATSLILTSVVIDMERIGDYTKDLAKIALFRFPELERPVYIESIKEWKQDLLEMFDLTLTAFKEDDEIVAKQVMDMNKRLRADTDLILQKLEMDKKIRGREAIVYTLYTRYFRRVSAHLENIASSVVHPFPYVGFKPRKEKK